ncbi:MAG: glycine--tRNA ligase, partial [Clostridiales bacterium]|nr:glycine--tRNA ligase [Clostridiales bacterium]
QIGKSFRNEITPGNFIFRTREFEQMELEFFCEPGTELDWYKYWREYCYDFLRSLNLSEDNLRKREHSQEELCHYSNGTTDIEYLFPFGWGELWGIASRTDYDLKAHAAQSGKSMEYMDPFTNAKYVPYCIEPSVGAGRLALAFLCDAYDEEQLENGDVRNVLHLHPALAPYKAAILPLQKKLGDKARELYTELSKYFMVDYDETGAIGKRYRRQDEIGTPLCITVDFETIEGETADTVTVRDRDSMEQIRLPISELRSYIENKLAF